MNKKNVIIISILVVIGLIGFLIYYNSTFELEKVTKNIDYDTNDYIEVKTRKYLKKNEEETEWVSGKVKEVIFKNLPQDIIEDFKDRNNKFVNELPPFPPKYTLTNEINYEIDDNILSLYSKENVIYEFEQNTEDYSLNIDLVNKKIISNKDLLKKYNIKIDKVYESILNNLVDNVKIDFFLLSTKGDITAEKISLKEFEKNIPNYINKLNNKYDDITLYLHDGNLFVTYTEYKVLNLLGMSSHNNIGLVLEPLTVKLNN